MPLAATLVVFNFCQTVLFLTPKIQWIVAGFIILFNVIAPLISIFFLYRAKYVSSFYLNKRKERPIPMVIATIYQCALSYMFINKLNIGILMGAMMLSFAFTLVLLSIITNYYKISIHSAGISGVLGIFFCIHFYYDEFDMFFPIVITILILGAVMTARLALNVHTPMQLLLGFLVGILTASSSACTILMFASEHSQSFLFY